MSKEEKKVMAQYEAVRRSGLTNMFDRHAVMRIASDNDFHDLVVAADENYGNILKRYSEIIEMVSEDEIPEVN